MNREPYEEQAVRQLQRFLRQLSYFDDRLPAVPVDGIFGDETRRALMIFQESAQLPVTGTADAVTWAALYDAYQDSLSAHCQPLPVDVFPRHPADYAVSNSNDEPIVLVIQYLLRELMIEYGYDVDLLPVTGTFDRQTADAIRDFQRIYGLPPDGAVDRATWNALVLAREPQARRYWQE